MYGAPPFADREFDGTYRNSKGKGGKAKGKDSKGRSYKGKGSWSDRSRKGKAQGGYQSKGQGESFLIKLTRFAC
jgi:hypothetical protein